MNYAVFRCCPTSIFLKQYETSTDAVLKKLGVKFKNIKDFNCCGYPLKNIDFKAYLLSSGRNIALAAQKKVNIVTVCDCCYGSLRQAQHHLNNDAALRNEIDKTLKKEGLRLDIEAVKIRHMLDVLLNDIGPEPIKEKMQKTYRGLKIATHYGCHILRPSNIVGFDSPVVPSKFDQLVDITGAESVPWSAKLQCCGSPMWGSEDELSMDLTEKKVANARQSGADYLCVTCAYCQLQFDRVQNAMVSMRNIRHPVPSILYTQLLGLALDVNPALLGIDRNQLSPNTILDYLA